MSGREFLRSPALDALGLDHGLGKALSWASAPESLICMQQVHGIRTVEVPPQPNDRRADALWTRAPGLAVGIYTADCVPILLVDAACQGVAAVHAGWRGSAARMAEHAVSTFVRGLGVKGRDLTAVIGPHIGPCCYEVDEPVRRAVALDSVFSPAARAGHYQLDLFALNRSQLENVGIQPERIQRVGGCTFCDERYASFRRDGAGVRMLHFIRLPGT